MKSGVQSDVQIDQIINWIHSQTGQVTKDNIKTQVHISDIESKLDNNQSQVSKND